MPTTPPVPVIDSDSLLQELGEVETMGFPYHGLVRNGSLTLPNGSVVSGYPTSFYGSIRASINGVPAVTRTAEQALADTALGFNYRSDASLLLAGYNTALNGMARIGTYLYHPTPGGCWKVLFPTAGAMGGVAGNTLTANPATVSKFGRINYDYGTPEVETPIHLVGFTADSTTAPYGALDTMDQVPDGSRILLGSGLNYTSSGISVVDVPAAYSELLITGDGSVGAPISVTLSKVSLYGESQVPVSVSNTLVKINKYFRWNFVETKTDIDEGRDCPSEETTFTPAQIFEVPPYGTSSSHWDGSKQTTLTGLKLGYWYSPTGDLVPVTANYRYKVTSTYTLRASGTGSPPARRVHTRDSTGLECVYTPSANAGAVTWPEIGKYLWDYETKQVTEEELEITLLVDGVEIDTHLVTFVGTYTESALELGDYTMGVGSVAPVITGTTITRVEELRVDGALFDSISEVIPTSTTSPFPYSAALIKKLDRNNYSESLYYQPHTWLHYIASSITLAPGRKIWSCSPHWWTTKMVCLKVTTSEPPLYPEVRKYGKTAYPGGVTGAEITPPLLPDGSSAFVYGALNPFTGIPLLGELDIVVYV